ncbi:Putative cellulose/chitin-binding protein [Septoria linicola]|uniref:Cellulose/chitin-binding protein n=1 Tax=Septoria linicola TaxID=215465 RepID=A0A9Q9EM39_9PEZI|nr:Putative cellulose/chitin-binding protein [Septoria linicola]
MKYITAIAALLELVSAHGYFESPIARQPGDAYKAACGEQAYNMMASDINGNIQGLQNLVASQSDYDAETCGLWQCKGMKFEDNTDRVQSYTAGEEVPLYFNIRAPHSGYANVSIVETASNSIIAANLSSWDEYALTSEPMKTSWTNFTVTIPDDLGSKCSTAGDCVLQMHWNAPPPVDQTYQSCIDLTVGGGSGSGSGSGSEVGSGSGSGSSTNTTDTAVANKTVPKYFCA